MYESFCQFRSRTFPMQGAYRNILFSKDLQVENYQSKPRWKNLATGSGKNDFECQKQTKGCAIFCASVIKFPVRGTKIKRKLLNKVRRGKPDPLSLKLSI